MPAHVQIYALCQPQTGEIKYIGKANNADKRYKSHLRECRRRRTPVYLWINKLLKNNLLPQLKVLTVVAVDKWEEIERKYIATHREFIGDLLNVADGGDEPHCPIEVRRKNGKKAAVSRVSTPRKKELYRAKQMLGIALRQGYVSEKTKDKMRKLAVDNPRDVGLWAGI